MRNGMGTIGALVLCYMAWLALWAASLSGVITSELSHQPGMWAGVGGVLMVCVWLAQSSGAKAMVRAMHIGLKGWHLAALLSLCVAGVTSYIALESFGATPRAQDEINYFFMGKMFATGHLWLEGLPANEFLSFRFFVVEDRIYSLFQPGWPAMLALGHLIGAAWLVGPVCAAVATFLLYLVARELLDETHALWATAMMSCGQAWWFQGASMMSHMFACLLGLAAVYFALRARRGGHEKSFALCAGACFGAMFTVRAGTAVALSVPVIVVGAYLVVRGRLSWRVAAAFGVGLALTGSLQLVYNGLLSGHPLVFPQDHYFNLTEPLERCHRLGIGEGIGCPYEHGPDLGRDGFTWARAWEVTMIRVEQLRWDMFGTGVALWTAVFMFVSRKLFVQKIFLVSLCLAVMGLYFFYYYHGNLYGARYYFEVLPYLMMCLVTAWMSLLDLIERVCVRHPRTRRVLSAGVVGLVLCMPAHHLLEGFKKKHDYYASAWMYLKAVERAEASSELENAVIIMPNAARSYWTGFAQNRGDLAGDRIYVRDWGAAMNARLKAYYPARDFYRPRFSRGEVTFAPTTLPEYTGRFVVEGEALFPVPEHYRGYAVPQSLSPWPEARASRQEHLLFENTERGSWLRFRVYVTRGGSYQMEGRLTAGPDYGMVRWVVNDVIVAPSYDGHDGDVVVKSWRGAEAVQLVAGWNTITLEVMGKADASRGFVAGIDQLTFTAVE